VKPLGGPERHFFFEKRRGRENFFLSVMRVHDFALFETLQQLVM